MRHLSALILAGTPAMTGYSFADTITVCESGCDFTTISAAINAASDGDTITIAAGNYSSGGQVEDIALSIIGETNTDGSPAVIIDGALGFSGQGTTQSFIENLQCTTMTMVDCTASIGNCTIVDGQDNAAGVVLAHFQGSLEGCRIANCHAEFLPGGVYVTDQFDDMQIPSTDATFIDCVIENNSGSCPFPNCTGDSGVTLEHGTVEFIGCTIRDNAAGFGGILVSSLSTASFTDTTVCGNSSPGQIYGVWVDNGGNCVQDSCDDCNATYNVPGDYPTIQGAIDASSDGDVVNIAAGTYNEYDINPGGKAITIQGTLDGDGTLATTIDAQQNGRVFVITSGEDDGTMIRDLVITGGLSVSGEPIPESGGGIYCANQSSPIITNCTISNNTADGGGGIHCEFSSDPIITDCTISNNTAMYGGGIVCLSSKPTISGCTIEYNLAEDGGGGGFACALDSSPEFTNCTISNNTGQEAGGIAIYNNSDPIFTDCMISNNTASDSNGGGMSVSGQSFPILTRCTIEGNSAASTGGGAYCLGGFPLLTDCTIGGNSAVSAGGGLYCQGSYPLLIGCTVSDNTAGKCGGIKSTASSLGLENTTVCGNTVDQICGAYEDEGGNFVADDCVDACPGDFDGSGTVDVTDLLAVIGSWGDPYDVTDLLLVISEWGSPCP